MLYRHGHITERTHWAQPLFKLLQTQYGKPNKMITKGHTMTKRSHKTPTKKHETTKACSANAELASW